MERQLLANRVRTPDGTILHSKHRHDYVAHEEENGDYFAIDGGNDLYRRYIGDYDKLVDVSVYSDSDWNEVREHFLRGTHGVNGDEPLRYVALKDIDDEWLDAIIEYEEEHRPENKFLWVWRNEKVLRDSEKLHWMEAVNL